MPPYANKVTLIFNLYANSLHVDAEVKCADSAVLPRVKVCQVSPMVTVYLALCTSIF